MTLSSSQPNRLATSHFWEPNTVKYSHSLIPDVLSSADFSNLDEDDAKSLTQKPNTCLSRQVSPRGGHVLFFLLPCLSRVFTTDFLSLPASLSSLGQQHVKDLPRHSLLSLDLSELHGLNQSQDPLLQNVSRDSPPNTRVKTPHRAPSISKSPKHAVRQLFIIRNVIIAS